MSNVALFNLGSVPAFAQNIELSDMAKSLAGGVDRKSISIAGGFFRLRTNGEEVASIEERWLNVVLVKAAPKINRVFYLKKYDGEASAPPDCWSADGVKPHTEAENPQHHQCDGCPQNISGSGQGSSRACRFYQKLAVVTETDMGGDVLQMNLSATSIFGKADGDNRPLQAYARYLAAQGINPEMVVTQMRFDTKSDTPKLFFKPVRWLTDAEYDTVKEQANTPEAVAAVTMTVPKKKVVDEAPMAIPGKPLVKKVTPKVEEDDEEVAAIAAPVKKVAPKVEEDDIDAEVAEVAEPKVRKESTRTAVSASTKTALAGLINEWGNDD
jgi:hypothetical protein